MAESIPVPKSDKLPKPPERSLGICPFMSQGVIIPSQVLPGKIQSAKPSIGVVSAAVACAGEGCQLWDGYYNQCSMKTIAIGVTDFAESVARPRNPEAVARVDNPKDRMI